MTDPFSVLATSLTIADTSKKVIDVCTEYLSHAKNAPKEFQTIIEDVHDLAGTIERLENFAKSREERHQIEVGFNQWQTPLRRLDGYAKDLVRIVERQDLKYGIFHEIGFRTRWPTAWREVQPLLGKIEIEKNKLHLAVAMEGVGLSRKVYMLVDERLTQNMHIQSQNKHSDVPNETTIVWRSLLPTPQDELAVTIRKQISKFTPWPDLSSVLDLQDRRHHELQNLCGERTCEEFLSSKAYQGWKNRKTRGPSLLFVSGSVASGKSILCSQVIQDLENAFGTEVGVAYNYRSTVDCLTNVPQTWIAQLALRCSCVPLSLEPSKVIQEKPSADASGADFHFWRQQYHGYLQKALFSILPNFRRTYLILDGFSDVWDQELSAFIRALLEQDFGNVNIAIFSRPYRSVNLILDLADVSIRLLKAEPSPNSLLGYCRSRVESKVIPELVTAGFRQPEIWLGDIEKAICAASDGLYLAVDMFIDSTVEALRDGTPIGGYLAYIKENSEIMMQRDPEIMKQKNFGPNVPNPESSYSSARKET